MQLSFQLIACALPPSAASCQCDGIFVCDCHFPVAPAACVRQRNGQSWSMVPTVDSCQRRERAEKVRTSAAHSEATSHGSAPRLPHPSFEARRLRGQRPAIHSFVSCTATELSLLRLSGANDRPHHWGSNEPHCSSLRFANEHVCGALNQSRRFNL